MRDWNVANARTNNRWYCKVVAANLEASFAGTNPVERLSIIIQGVHVRNCVYFVRSLMDTFPGDR